MCKMLNGWNDLLFPQHICLLQPPTRRSEIPKEAGSKHTFPLINRSTVWTTSSGLLPQHHHPSEFTLVYMLMHQIPVILFIVLARVCVFQIFGELYRSSPQAEEWHSFPGYLFFFILYLRRWQACWSHWHGSGQLRRYNDITQFNTQISVSLASVCYVS